MACTGSALKTFHQIIIFVVELEGVKIDNFRKLLCFFCFLIFISAYLSQTDDSAGEEALKCS